MFRRKNRQGAEAIEFALVFPIYFMIVMAIIEFGRAFQVCQWLTQAAREGGRLAMLYAVVNQTDRDQGITNGNMKVDLDVKNFLKASGVSDGVSVSITSVDGNGDSTGALFDIDDYALNAGKYFMVRVEVPYEKVKLMTPIYMSDTQILKGEIVLRHE